MKTDRVIPVSMYPCETIDSPEASMIPFIAAVLLGMLVSLQAQAPAKGRQVRVAAAADLKWALEEARQAFEKANPGVTCTLTFGSSGNLYNQLAQKAPFDLYLSADLGFPQKLADQGLALKDTLFTYALGHVVVWVPKSSSIPVESLGMKAVRHPSVRKIAIANPKVAPYGRAAEAALRASGMLEVIQDKLVLGDNVAQTAQFIQTGNADIGLISLSLATSAPMRDVGRFWTVPGVLYPPLEQGGVVMTWAQDKDAALAFRAFLLGPKGRAVLTKYGFADPTAR